ncbi:hypothetical protein GCM10011351_32160 [Paraliobacillus quinghaiensis]|uniref:Uncharacterized protein n=1 Tax=Paraliobacillus quinghaiensis TaxID=470815 RepID=A0A917WZD7_9BACI|nr:hypothetical protein [Paraliobacillus quinghaiensis]GGM43745.1 hypothetical protein GCM10011351_32160 [Paraliobacillus quinghaiensis]
MKKLISLSLIALLSVVLLYLVVFSNFEIGKYDDFQEAIEKGIPNKVNDIIHTEKYDNVTIVMYTTNPNKEELPLANYEASALAFFKGSDKEGWENIGHHGWTHYENDNMTVYREPLREYDNQGNELHEFYVVFGEVNNPEITRVETKTKEEKSFDEVEIISYQGTRYYFKIGNEMVVRGLSESGDVIDRQGG